MKKVLANVVFVTFLGVMFLGFTQEIQAADKKVPGVTADTITVGGIVDMTGPVASTLAPYCEGTKDYIKMINDKGGIHGRKIVWKWEDDQWKVDKALAAFRKIKDDIFVILSTVGSSQFAALDPEITEAKMLVIGPGQSTRIQAENPYTYNVMLSYDDMGTIMVKRAVETFKGSGKPKIGIFAPHGASSAEFIEACKNAAKKLGSPVVVEEIIAYGTSELASQVTKLKQAGANALMFLANAPMMTVYLRDAARLGATDIKVVSGYSSIQSVIFETVGREASQSYEGIHPFTPISGEGSGVEEMRQAAEKYKTARDTAMAMNYPQGWMTGVVFVEALKRAGRDLTRESFQKAIEEIKNFETSGLSGPVTYGPKKHNGVDNARFYKYDFDKKDLIPVSKWYDAELK
jgi:branched-chain amino acid transport system substrate-binding protein